MQPTQKKTTTALARAPRQAQVLQPNKTCKCGACEPRKPRLPKGMRRLKVYSKYSTGYTQVPVILLQGEWLRNIGFDIGDEIIVTMNQKQLIPDFGKR